MVEMQGLTLQQLADLYDASTPEIRRLLYYNFWDMELDQMIEKLGDENPNDYLVAFQGPLGS